MNALKAILLGAAMAMLAVIATAEQNQLIVGPNINMVSGTTWPDGDPFLRQQNEPSVAFSSRNKLHLLSGANDYRTVDVPGDQGAGATGDSWLSYFWSTNGGGTWKSTLIPGYPQQCNGTTDPLSPLCAYAAGADPVVRAGTHGLFYYSGIVFERTENNPGSAIFVSRLIDLNNDEGGDPIRFIDTTLIDTSDLFQGENPGEVFLDKSWIAVDLPRAGATEKTFMVDQYVLVDGEMVNQPATQVVQCGHVYVGYAGLTGEADGLRSEIKVKRSADCGDSWEDLGTISEPDSLNQGANIAVDPGTGRVHVGWRRFDTVEAFLGTPAFGCAKALKEWKRQKKKKKAVEWPVEEVTIGDLTLIREDALDLLGQKHRGDKSVQLAQELVAAKLNLLSGGGAASDSFDPALWTETLSQLTMQGDDFFLENPLQRFERDSKSSKSSKSDKSDKSDKSAKNSSSDDWEETDAATYYMGENLSDSERVQAKELRKTLKANYLGSESCVATTGVDASSTGETNAIMWASAGYGSGGFSTATAVAEVRTFDQGGTTFSFRTTAYPSVAVDASGHVYMVYAARGFASNRGDAETGDARIVLSMYDSGTGSWMDPYPIDDDPASPGHQIKPAILFAGGKLVVVYYDFREDVSNVFEQFVVDVPEAGRLRHSLDVRVAAANTPRLPVSIQPQFTAYDVSDGRASQRASRYMFSIIGGGVPLDPLQLQFMVPNLPTHAGGTQPFIGDYVDVAAKVFLKENGVWRYATEPGDVDVYQAVWTDNRDIVRPPDGDWTRYVAPNIDPMTGQPSGGGSRTSLFDGSEISACSPAEQDFTGSRNQNVYTAALTEGLVLAAPGNNRPLIAPSAGDALERRAYVIFTQNTSSLTRYFKLTLEGTSDTAESFDQFDLAFADDALPAQIEKAISIDGFGSAAQTVYVALRENGSPDATVTVRVVETDPQGEELSAGLGLESSVVLNSDTSAPPPVFESLAQAEVYTPSVLNPSVLNPSVLNPSVFNPSVLNPSVLNPSVLNPSVFNPSVFNPSVLNPSVFNPSVFNPSVFNPSVFNPSVLNPSVFNPSVLNPSVFNPSVLNPSVFNPSVLNPSVLNPSVLNPSVFNPSVLNPSVLNPSVLNTAVEPSAKEVTFQVQNDGTATGAYDIDLSGARDDDGLSYEIVVYRLNITPIAEGCNPGVEAQQELITSVVESGGDLNGDNSASFYVAPGDNVYVTVRAFPDGNSPTPIDPATIPDVDFDVAVTITPQPVAPAQAALPGGGSNPGGGSQTAPTAIIYSSDLVIDSTVLAPGTAGAPYSEFLVASGGSGPVSWALSDPAELTGSNLSLDGQSGLLSGTPPAGPGAVYGFDVIATDDLQSVQGTIALEILASLSIDDAPLPSGLSQQIYGPATLMASGGTGSYTWSLVNGSLPPGLSLASAGTISGTPTASGRFTFSVQASDGQQSSQREVFIDIATAFEAATLESRYYAVNVANPGYTSRGGSVLDFNQIPQTGAISSVPGSSGEPVVEPFTWNVVDGKLVATYDTPLVSDGFDTDYSATTATPAQIALLEAESLALGFRLGVSSQITTTSTTYTRVVDGDVDIISKEDAQSVVYTAVDLTATGQGSLQLAPRVQVATSADTLREESVGPAVNFSDNCAAVDGSICVPGFWGGSYRYAPGDWYFDSGPLPTTDWGDVLTFTQGAGNDVVGTISGVAATWSVSNGRLVIDYGDGWTQTVTIVENNGVEYGVFSEYVNGAQSYNSYKIWVKGDPAFNMSEAYLQSQPGHYWNGDINAWIPGNIDENGARIPDIRFGWKYDAGTSPNSGFNRFLQVTDDDLDGEDEITASLRPIEWAFEPGRLKIDRFLDTQFETFDRYWYPLAGVVRDGERQLYVMEVEQREDGLLFAARLNIEREIEELNNIDSVVVLEPVISSGAPEFLETIITGDSSILNEGLLVAANDLGGAPTAATVNGVDFGIDQGGQALFNGGGDFSVDPVTATWSAALDSLLSNQVFSGTLAPRTLTIGGLTIGEEYRLQLLFSNDLNLTGNNVQISLQGESWVLDDWQDDAINLSPVFTASATSAVVSLQAGPDYIPGSHPFDEPGRAVLSAYAIHQLPSCDNRAVPVGAGPGPVIASSNLDRAVPFGDQTFVRYDFLNFRPAVALTGNSLVVPGENPILSNGGGTADNFVIYAVSAGAAAIPAGTSLQLTVGEVALPQARIEVRQFPTLAQAVNAAAPCQ